MSAKSKNNHLLGENALGGKVGPLTRYEKTPNSDWGIRLPGEKNLPVEMV